MSDAHVTGGDMTAPTLILPDVHHVTGGPENVHVNACQADTSHPSVRAVIDAARQMFASPRIWWWPVESEWGRSDDVRAAPLPVRVPPPDLVALTEPCDTCPIDQRGWVLVRDLPSGRTRWEHCPDCYRGKRIVQLVHGGKFFGGASHMSCETCWIEDTGPATGAVLVARVTITLLPVVHNDQTPMLSGWRGIECWDDGAAVLWIDGDSTPLPFEVETGQWVLRAEEVTGTD